MMFYKRLAGAVLALATVGLGVLLLASPAQAADGHLPSQPWQALDTTGVSFIQGPSVLSHIVDPYTVHLEADATDLESKGTSVETLDLDLAVQAQQQISFEYELLDGATCTGGAPRVFVEIDGVFINSWDQLQPSGTQCGVDGLVTFTATTNGRIGAAGIVYDSGAGGAVEVSNLTVNGQLVLFTAPMSLPGVEFEDHCDGTLVQLTNGADAQADAVFTVSGLDDGPYQLIPGLTPEALLVTGGEVTVVETVTGEEWTHTWTEPEGCDEAGPDPEASESPAPGVAGGVDDGRLPVTGSPLPWIALAGVVLIVAGAGLYAVFGSRQRVTFSA